MELPGTVGFQDALDRRSQAVSIHSSWRKDDTGTRACKTRGNSGLVMSERDCYHRGAKMQRLQGRIHTSVGDSERGLFEQRGLSVGHDDRITCKSRNRAAGFPPTEMMTCDLDPCLSYGFRSADELSFESAERA